MTDDLVKRLRDHIAVSFDDRGHVFEDEVLCDDAADRIEELEAKLAKAVKALKALVLVVEDSDSWVADTLAQSEAVVTLAELKGETND